MYIQHNTNSLPGSPEPMEPLERVSARLGSLASTQRRKTGGGPEQGDDIIVECLSGCIILIRHPPCQAKQNTLRRRMEIHLLLQGVFSDFLGPGLCLCLVLNRKSFVCPATRSGWLEHMLGVWRATEINRVSRHIEVEGDQQ